MQRTLILLSGTEIKAADLTFEKASGEQQSADLSQGLRNREYQLIIDAINTHGGKRSDVAAALGISPRSLRYKLARMRDEGVVIPGERP